VDTELLLQLWTDDGNRPTYEPLAEMNLLPRPLPDNRDTLPSDSLDRSPQMHQPYQSAQVAYTEFDDLNLARTSGPATGAAQAIHTVPNDLSTANIHVSLATDEDDNLIMTWLDGYGSQYLFYALADSDGNILTPATIFQRTRHSYLWSSWNGYGNDTLSISHVATAPGALYLPLVVKNYPPPPPQQPVENGQFELGGFTHWTVGGDEAGLTPRVVTSEHYGGSYAALLGQENAPCQTGQGGLVGQSWIYQDITVPDSGSPKLLLYYRVLSYDKLNADDYDRFEIYIDGALLGRFGNTNPGNHGSGRCTAPIDDTDWQQFTYDLTAYRGQTIRLRLVNITHPDDWYGTWAYVDDVQLTDYY
jgi:hypothetical protein